MSCHLFVCGCRGAHSLFWGSLLTLAVQGLRDQESKGRRGDGMRVDLLAPWWPEPPPWTEIFGLPALIRLVTWELVSEDRWHLITLGHSLGKLASRNWPRAPIPRYWYSAEGMMVHPMCSYC